MKDSNKHSFEEEFKKVFEEAEATPSPVLWAEIDAHLANQETARYKRRLLYYKISAAAAVVLLVSFIGLWSLNNDLSGGNNNLAVSQQANSGNAPASSENSNQTRTTATDEGVLQENTARANNVLEEGTAEKNSLNANPALDKNTTQAKQASVSSNAQEVVARQSPNANAAPTVSAKSPAAHPEVASDQPETTTISPVISSGQPTLADNTQAPAVKKPSGKQTQDGVVPNGNTAVSSTIKSADQVFDVADLTSSKTKISSQKKVAGTDAELTSTPSANRLAKNGLIPSSKSGVVGVEQEAC